jgi:hypothetical protein
MTIPSYRDVDLALLVELVRSPVPLRPAEAIQRVVKHFPQLTEEDLAETRPDGRMKTFYNMVNWGRNHLRVRGLLVSGGGQGIWCVIETASEALVQDLVQRGAAADRAERFVRSDEALGDLLGVSWARPVSKKSGGAVGADRRSRDGGASDTRVAGGLAVREPGGARGAVSEWQWGGESRMGTTTASRPAEQPCGLRVRAVDCQGA